MNTTHRYCSRCGGEDGRHAPLCLAAPEWLRSPEADDTHAELIQLRADLAAARADAEQYRWIRSNPIWIGYEHDVDPSTVDNEVDAALKGNV